MGPPMNPYGTPYGPPQAAISDGRASAIPTPLLEVDELLLDSEGVIAPGSRVVGTNDVGMVGWHATLKTPEYPDGRPLVIVANDCTVQSVPRWDPLWHPHGTPYGTPMGPL